MKKHANNYIKYIQERTGIKFRCRRLKDYIFLETLYLLLVDYENLDEEFYQPVFNYYGKTYYKQSYKDVEKKLYFGYSLHDIINQYIVKYYYGDITNFAVAWEYYDRVVNGENYLEQAFRVFEKKIDKNNSKIIKLLDNISMQADDYYVAEVLNESKGTKHVIWHTQRDNTVCPECSEHNGKKYYNTYNIPERHPNCRCWLEIIED